MRGDEDQFVQQTCFNVVDEEVARQAGLRVDILVGRDHGLPLSDQIRALCAEETRSAGSSVIPTHSSEDSHSGQLRPLPVTNSGPQPATATIGFSGPNLGLQAATFISKLRDGEDVA